MKNILLLLSVLFFFNVFAQDANPLNMEFKSRVDYMSLHGAQLSSIWGYVDEEGNEYAIVGTDRGTSIVNVTNPENPVEIFWRPGVVNIWREAKTFGDFAYISSESGEGVLIIDLSPLPQSTNLSYNYFTGNSGVSFDRVHTLWVDEPTGYLYLFGVNYSGASGIICDLNVSLTNPTVVNTFSDVYIHDGIIQGDRMYTGNIQAGYFRVYDVTDRVNPVLLGSSLTPHTFTHNVAPTPDNQFAFTTDELANAFIASYDVSDPTNIRELDRIRSTDGTSTIPHNVHYKDNNFLVTSYYTDGVLIHDVSRPHNMVKVGSYDTTPLSTATFDGCWGVYPYFPSGNIVASDIQLGMFVIAPNYKRAGYLEGKTFNAHTNAILSNVVVEIVDRTKYSNTDGEYGVGTVVEGPMQVKFSKMGFVDHITTVNFSAGQVLDLDVYLVPLDPIPVKIVVLDDETGLPVLQANVALDMVDGLTYEGQTNGLGEREFNIYYETEHVINVALWGYRYHCQSQIITAETEEIVIRLTKGYSDNFRFDLGWVTTATAQTGLWERAIPFESEGGANPGFDSPDCDKYAFVTGNSTIFGISVDDVDDGVVRLISPMMDLTSYTDPHVNFHYWFYNFYGENTPDDKYRVRVRSNGTLYLIAEYSAPAFLEQFQWYYASIPLNGLVPISDNMQVLVDVSDLLFSDNITEGGFDNFSISNANAVAVDQVAGNNINVFPNPFTDELYVGGEWSDEIRLMDVQGKEMNIEWKSSGVLNTSALQSGVYFVYTQGKVMKVIKK